VSDYYRSHVAKGKELVSQWNNLLESYRSAYPEQYNDLVRRMNGELPSGWKNLFPSYSPADTKAVATRSRSEEVINAITPLLTELIGGSADLTLMKCSGDFQKETPQGRYIRFGVREHAMAGICNGLMSHGGIRPYCATFLNFIGYALGAVRLSALSHFGIIYVMTHDSIGLGEDGPTHQPVETLETLRALPNLLTIRPCDGNETSGAYQVALEHTHSPTVISLSRQGVPTLEGTNKDSVASGAYLLKDFKSHAENQPYPTLTLISSGTEVSLAMKVASQMIDEVSNGNGNGNNSSSSSASSSLWIRVISAPCLELFAQQSLEYQKSLLMPGSPVMSIEASVVTSSWKKYAHAVYGIPDCFGMSAPADQIYKYFGFDIPNLIKCSKDVISFYSTSGVVGKIPYAPSLLDCPVFQFPNKGPFHEKKTYH
jgi:transketolase